MASDATREPATRERLLVAARALFAEVGYAATSTRAVAARAGCNLSLIRHYFGSKEGMLREVVRGGLEEMSGKVRGVGAEGPPRERFARYVDVLLDHLDRNRDLMRIVHRELIQTDSPLLDEFRTAIAGNLEVLAAIFRDAHAEERMPGFDPRVAAMLLQATLQFYFIAYPLASRWLGPRSPAVLDRIKRHVTAIFLGGILEAPR